MIHNARKKYVNFYIKLFIINENGEKIIVLKQ